jgi:hypothetical protein
VNLLKETTEAISDSGHTPEQIVFIGSRASGHECTWAEFQALANVEYDNGYGPQEVASDLEIAFTDGATMTRREYDGAEAWQFSVPFTRPSGGKPITRLIVPNGLVGWCTLAECCEVQP